MKKTFSFLFILSLLLITGTTSFAQSTVNTENDTAMGKRKDGDPFTRLPANIERLTYFGERADISPDNKRVAFMAKSFGDAMVIDLQTKKDHLPDLWHSGRGFFAG